MTSTTSQTGDRTASAGVLSLLIDAGTVALLAAVAAIVASSAPLVAAGIVAAAATGAILLWRSSLGSSPGHAALRLRTVHRTTGMPAAPWRRPRATVDVRRDGDPLVLSPRPVTLDADPGSSARPDTVRTDRLRVVVDDGTTHIVPHAALVGRDPTVPNRPDQILVAIPDLTRTVSKEHALIEVAPEGVYVTDLGGEGRTRLVDGDTLTPGVRTLVPWGATLQLGHRAITLERRTRHLAVTA